MIVIVQFLLVASFVLLATMPLVSLVLLFRGSWRGVLVALSFVVGSCGSGALAWYSVPSQWTLPFRTTLEAAVNVEKYGHAIEHSAENILVFVTFACVAGGALCVGIAASSLKLWSIAKPVRPRGETSR